MNFLDRIEKEKEGEAPSQGLTQKNPAKEADDDKERKMSSGIYIYVYI